MIWRIMRNSILFFLLFVVAGLSTAASTVYPIELKENWEFRRHGDPSWKPASVPGSVQVENGAGGGEIDQHAGDIHGGRE